MSMQLQANTEDRVATLLENSNKQFNLSEEKRKGIIFTYFVGAVLIVAALNTIQNLYLSLTVAGDVGKEYASYNTANFIFVIVLGLILVGHRWYPLLMRHIFIVILIAGTIFFFELGVLGGLLVILTLPIIMAAFLIKPVYSFFYYFLIIGIFTLRLYLEGFFNTDFNEEVFPFLGLISLVALALIAWLIANSLEKALAESWALNKELDQRVQDRTQKLAQSLEREHTAAVRNKTILESIADGVLVFDAKNQVMIANPAANLLAGRDLDTFNLADFLATVDTKASKLLETWINGEKPPGLSNVKFEWHQRTISANVAPVVLSKSATTEIDAGNVMVLRDFTREAELEKAKTMFLGMVSHELRTPMSAIKGYVNVLLNAEKERLSETGVEYLYTIDVSIKQLLTLAGELIDLSRLESGEIELYREWVDLAPIVKQSIKMVQQEFASRNLSLNVKLEDNLPRLYLDRNRMLQILLNLLSNAYKYTAQGGATIQVDQAGDEVLISVCDTGVGIKPSDQANMFSRFFRANDQFVQKAGGTGLGLNITKGLTELHGGKLTFTSQYGVGTTFNVTLPKTNGVAQEMEDVDAYPIS